MAFCSDCGYSVHLAAVGAAAPAACPRCGSPGISGSEHHLDVVELSRVSAEMRRDEAVITDRNDERRRERFTIAVAADIDPAQVVRQWYVNDYDFGTKYLRRMDVRWVNLGRQAGHGSIRSIAGNDEPAPLFRVCEGCGVLDRSTRANRADEHRAWCRYRKAPDEHTRSIALTRTLTTQGAVIRLPLSITLGDRFAIPSLAAALLLGLHEQIGGSPDHIEIAHISEPVPGEAGATGEALLLHDVVPGGTGYLAELADPTRVWDLLHRAWERVHHCPCQAEPRLACHRCLLPFAAPWLVDSVSRAAAERHLRAILTAGAPDVEPAGEISWSLTTKEPDRPSVESHLEQSFRTVFTERVSALGATVKESPGPHGNRLTITFPGATRQWTLEPQVLMGASKPDFVLSSSQGGLPVVAIFTDGWQYHASPVHNRIADDAQKRQALRDGGAIVVGITARNVENAQIGAHDAPEWLRDDVTAELLSASVTFRPRTWKPCGAARSTFCSPGSRTPTFRGIERWPTTCRSCCSPPRSSSGQTPRTTSPARRRCASWNPTGSICGRGRTQRLVVEHWPGRLPHPDVWPGHGDGAGSRRPGRGAVRSHQRRRLAGMAADLQCSQPPRPADLDLGGDRERSLRPSCLRRRNPRTTGPLACRRSGKPSESRAGRGGT